MYICIYRSNIYIYIYILYIYIYMCVCMYVYYGYPSLSLSLNTSQFELAAQRNTRNISETRPRARCRLKGCFSSGTLRALVPCAGLSPCTMRDLASCVNMICMSYSHSYSPVGCRCAICWTSIRERTSVAVRGHVMMSRQPGTPHLPGDKWRRKLSPAQRRSSWRKEEAKLACPFLNRCNPQAGAMAPSENNKKHSK